MPRYLASQVLIWFRGIPERLTPGAHRVITEADSIAISDITLWELAMLARMGRIDVTGSLERYLADVAATIHVIPVTVAVAAAVASLGPDFPTGDPADQVIYWTALVQRVPLVSADARLRGYDPSVVWS